MAPKRNISKSSHQNKKAGEENEEKIVAVVVLAVAAAVGVGVRILGKKNYTDMKDEA